MKLGYFLFSLILNELKAVTIKASCGEIKSQWNDGECCGSDMQMALEYPAVNHSGSIASPSAPNAPLDALNTTLLYQTDFSDGTVRLKNSGIYKLAENINFEPNAAFDHWPVCSGNTTQSKYCNHGRAIGGYNLGFFAAVTMEGHDVHLDLNGKTIAMTPLFSLQQRFFSIIELADAPFIPGAGPGADANSATPGGTRVENGTISACMRCSVTNGRLGLSSHHAIHGNNASDILIKNITIANYEVAAISLNSVSRVLIEDVVLEGHRTDIPVRATYSAARFMLKFWTEIKGLAALAVNGALDHVDIQLGNPSQTFKNTAIAFQNSVKTNEVDVIMEYLHNMTVDMALSILDATRVLSTESVLQFGNFKVNDNGTELHLVDGNAYGIAFHGKGPLVGSFSQDFNARDSDCSTDITIKNVQIKNVLANVNEVLAPRGIDGKPMVDVAGGAVRLSEIFNFTTTIMAPDKLHDARFSLAFLASNDPFLKAIKGFRALGTLNIGGLSSNNSTNLPLLWYNSSNGTAVPTSFHVPMDYTQDVFCNFDSMHHKQKGTVGLFLQQTKRVKIENVSIHNVKNFGGKGSRVCGSYTSTPHDSTIDDHLGYTGSQAYGMLFNTARDISLKDIIINDVKSHHGDTRAFFINNDVERVGIQNIKSHGMSVGDAGEDSPNNVKRPTYLDIGDRVKDVKIVGTFETLL